MLQFRLTYRRAVACAPLLALVLQGEPAFTAVQPELFAAGATLTNAWADYDGDGDLDLYVGFSGAPNRLYQNMGSASRHEFRNVAADVGLGDSRATRSVAWADYDGDGDPDLLVGHAPGSGSVLRLYRNDRGRFTDVTEASGLLGDSAAVRQLTFIDVDADGDLDLFVALRDKPNRFYRNTNGVFTDVATEIGLADRRKSVGAVWFDYDEDGDLDVYVGNMDGDANALMQNDGGRFSDVADARGLAWGGRKPADATNGTVRPCLGDVDNDGHLDIMTANYGTNGLFIYSGNRMFTDRSSASGLAIGARYDACAFADVDHDGALDVYVNGTVTGGTSYRDYLMMGRGGVWHDRTPAHIQALQADHGVQWADYDNDGDLDLALTGARADGMHSLLRNDLPAERRNRSLSVRVLDEQGRATRAGAVVRIRDARSGAMLGSRIVDTGSGYGSQNDMPVHFGIPSATRVHITVTFPAAGRVVSKEVQNVEISATAPRSVVIRL